MQAVLTSKVERGVDGIGIPSDAADVDEAPLLLMPRPVADGDLAEANGRGEVDVEHRVVARVRVGRVSACGVRVRVVRPRGFPEGGPGGLEDAGAGDDDVDGGEEGEGLGPEGGELGPGDDVCLVEGGEGFV